MPTEILNQQLSEQIRRLEERLYSQEDYIDSLKTENRNLREALCSYEVAAGTDEKSTEGRLPSEFGDDFWRQVFDAINEIVTIHDEDFCLIKANKAAHEILLNNEKSDCNKRCYEIYTGEMKPCLKCLMKNSKKEEGTLSSIISNKKLNKVFQVYSSHISTKRFGKKYLIHVAKDISDEIEGNIDRILHESDERFGKAFDANPAPMVISTIDKGRFIDVNRQWLQMLGYDKEELIGNTSFDVGIWLEPHDRTEFLEILLKDNSVRDYPTVLVSKSGDLRSTLWSAEKITLRGREFMLSLITDITEKQLNEAALKESKEKFELAFDASPDAININRLADGLYVNINRGFTDLTGFTLEDTKGKTSFDINIWYDPEDRKMFVSELTQKGYCENYEAGFRRKDGSITVALISGRVITLNNQPHIISITRDISKLRMIEQETDRQRMLFKAMFEAISDVVVITDTNRHILMANKAIENIFGYTSGEMIGRSTYHLHAENDGFHTFGSLIYNDYSDKDTRRYITAYRSKSGKTFPGETLGVKLYDKDNEWIGNLSIIRDVSKRQKNEEEMGRLVAAIEQTNDAVVITDEKGSIQYVNSSFEKISGYSRGEALGQNPRILKSGEHSKLFYEELWKTLSENKTFKGRIVNSKKDGSLYTEEATISPICDESGQVVNYIGVKRDITDQLLLEAQYQQAQKMEAVGRLTGGVAHDFNNILTVIIGYAEQALEDIDDSHSLYKPLQSILDAGERSAKIISQLMTFSRKQTISPQIIDLNCSVSGMLSMIHRLIGENITVSWIPDDKRQYIKIDPTQIDQILANLCVNAKDAMVDSGQLTIETCTVNFDDEYCRSNVGYQAGSFVQLTVADNGCGIDTNVQEKVFEPFFTTKALGHGTGLGLSTVYGIVKQNAGFVQLDSELGGGTTIKLYFPTWTEKQIQVEENVKNTHKQLSDVTILLVEDEPSLIEVAEIVLSKKGYSVLAAETPEKAITLAKEHKGVIHLLLTDVVMPNMNGMELSINIKSFLPDLKVLFVSGHTANVIDKDCVVGENINFLQKPYSIYELTETIEAILAQDT